jgi:hypothetical protein
MSSESLINMDYLNNLIRYWKQDSSTLPVGATDLEVSHFETQYHVTLPQSFKTYIQTTNGNGGEKGEDLFRFWSLNEIKLVSEFLPDYHSDRFDYPDTFVFADWLIWSRIYAIHIDKSHKDGGQVFAVGGEEIRIVANSFEEFIEQYISNWEKLI